MCDEPLDQPVSHASGAGVIFGATGGVMEAALRSAYYFVTGNNPDADMFESVRGMEGCKAQSFIINGQRLSCAVVSGLGNTRKLIEAICKGDVHYDFVEVMACPGGCSGGGGQPIHDGKEMAAVRANALYQLDKHEAIRHSHENPDIQKLYQEYLEHPLSEKAEKLLHTDHFGWDMPSQKN